MQPSKQPLMAFGFCTVVIILLSLCTAPVFAQNQSGITVFGPETFTRTTAEPQLETRTFTITNTAATYTARVTNGAPEMTSAVIRLNGKTIFSPDDFKKKVASLERSISPLSQNTLAVEVRGKPGSFVTLEIILVTDVLPPEAPAIDAVPSPTNSPTQTITGIGTPDGTVTISGGAQNVSGICDPSGAFSIEVALNEGTNALSAWVTDSQGLESNKIYFDIVVDTIPPQISITSPANGSELTEDAVTVMGTVDDASATVTVNGQQALLVNTTFSAGGIRLSGGENSISVVATDPLGNTASAVITVTLATTAVDITITSPENGTIVTHSKVLVKGTYESESDEVGIVVNGVLATIFGNTFVANGVGIEPGDNTIEATITDTMGNTDTVSISLYGQPAERYVRLTSNINSGIAPLDVRLRAETFLGEDPLSTELIPSGPAEVPVTPGTSEGEFTLSFPDVPGIYYVTFSATDSAGTVYSNTTAVTVLDRAQLDARLQAKWGGMKEALSAGDIDGALEYFSEHSKGKYQSAFNIIAHKLPQIIADMQYTEIICVKNGIAKYRINRAHVIDGESVNITYYIYYTVDENGMWKIDKF